MQIVPAPLNYSIEEFVNLFNKLSPYFSTFQIDVQDGRYINNKTISLQDYLRGFKKANQTRINSSTFDFHLQTISYEQEIKLLSTVKDSVKIGFILVHYSLKPNLQKLKSEYPYFQIGIVLNPEDQVEELAKSYILNSLPCIQIMSIHPGPQGTIFMPETLNKIEQLHSKDYRYKILLDGGINQDSLPIILSKKDKPDVLCIGSYLTKTAELKDRLAYLSKIINIL